MRVPVKIYSNKHYVKLLNGIFDLTDKEIVLVGIFLDVQQENPGKYVFSKAFKDEVANRAEVQSNAINVYLKRFLTKKVLFKINKKYKFNPMLKPFNNQTEIIFVCQKA